MANAKLGRPSKERFAVLRNQVSYLLWYGRIETTVAKAKRKCQVSAHRATRYCQIPGSRHKCLALAGENWLVE